MISKVTNILVSGIGGQGVMTAAEALRWCGQLRPSGVAMVNRVRQEPPVVTLGLFPYPDDPVGEMRRRGIEVHAFDAGAIARDLGNLKLVNTVMLGAIADYLPFSATQ